MYKGDGINLDHIMASGTLPEFYDFREIGGRHFCDGGLLSNTPFRELLEAHRDYWLGIIHKQKQKKDNQTQKIPDLEVYIVNVHPATRDTVLDNDDHDGVKDRHNDITYSDRNSHYDQEMADLITDYMDLTNNLKCLAMQHFRSDVEKLLTSMTSTGHNRKYRDLLKGRFELTKVLRIGRENDKDSISGKTGDFTQKTINKLIKDGKCEAWFSIIQEEINDMELDDYDKHLLNKKLRNAVQNLRKGNYEDNDSQTYHLLAEFIKETQNKDKSKTHQSSKLVKSVEALMTILD